MNLVDLGRVVNFTLSMSNIRSVIVNSVFIIVVALGTWHGISFLGDVLEKRHAYNQLPETLLLKAAPKDIVYSEPYRNLDGEEGIKYAYLTEEVPPEGEEEISLRTSNSQTYILEREKMKDGEIVERRKTIFRFRNEAG